MAKLRRGTASAYSDDSSLRLRAAWLYHAYGMTQNEVADQLGIDAPPSSAARRGTAAR